MSEALLRARKDPTLPSARPLPWWLRLPLNRVVWSWQGAWRRPASGLIRRATLSVVPAALLVLLFAWLGRSAAGMAGGAVGLSTMLFLFQFCVLISSLPGRGGREPLSEPPGPLLPYGPAPLALLWVAGVAAPITAQLALAYGGIAIGYRSLTVESGVLAWLCDSLGLSALILASAAVRWIAGTYLPVEVRRAITFVWKVLIRNLAVLLFASFFAVALLYVVSGVFISPGFEKALEALPAMAGRDAQQVPANVALALDPLHRLTGSRHSSVMTQLLLEPGRGVSAMDLLTRFAGLLACVPLLVLPGRRSEHPHKIAVSGGLPRGWLSDALVSLAPRGWKVAARLSLPYLGDSIFFTLPASAILFTIALTQALSDAQLRQGYPPRASLPELFALFGYGLGALSALSLSPVLERIGLTRAAYAQLCSLPVDLAVLLRRMATLCLGLVLVQQLSVAVVWGRLMKLTWGQSGLFALGMFALACGGLATTTWLHTRFWKDSPRLGLASAGLLLAWGGLMVLDYHVLHFMPSALAWVVSAEAVVAVAAMTLIGRGLEAMILEREPESN